MKYLSIPGTLLSSMRLSAEEKILISYVYMWQRQPRQCKKNYTWIALETGLVNPEKLILELGRKGIIEETEFEIKLSSNSFNKLLNF
jgi:hypothetical protein